MFKRVSFKRISGKRIVSTLLMITMISSLTGCGSEPIPVPAGWSTYDNGVYQISFDEELWDATPPVKDSTLPGGESFYIMRDILLEEVLSTQTMPSSGALLVVMSMSDSVDWDGYIKAQLEVDKARGAITKESSNEISTSRSANYHKEYTVGSDAGAYLKIMEAVVTPAGSVIVSSFVFDENLKDDVRGIYDALAPSGNKSDVKKPEFSATIDGQVDEPASDPTPVPGPSPDTFVPDGDPQAEVEGVSDVPALPAGGADGTITAPFVYRDLRTGETTEYLVYYTEPNSIDTSDDNTRYSLTYDWGTVEINSMFIDTDETATSVLQKGMDTEVKVMNSLEEYSGISISEIKVSEHDDLYCEVHYTMDTFGSKYVTQRLADKVADGKYIMYTTSMKLGD